MHKIFLNETPSNLKLVFQACCSCHMRLHACTILLASVFDPRGRERGRERERARPRPQPSLLWAWPDCVFSTQLLDNNMASCLLAGWLAGLLACWLAEAAARERHTAVHNANEV